ncbi:hypothetical protein [Cupriavidus oxalaticus]|uniref:Uncharacterized protein n=1 Tax=Cupriavidus oxalaticus TaxID=96344 RepID=A0A4P7LN51_9BURK|nr:hypothetical protein [Cupriavidus oxalaticus]QBY56259.1 hypothetical protein E0W60_35045 [Cupriavidus oxalaticus]
MQATNQPRLRMIEEVDNILPRFGEFYRTLKQQQGRGSRKRGDTTLRTILMHGASSSDNAWHTIAMAGVAWFSDVLSTLWRQLLANGFVQMI